MHVLVHVHVLQVIPTCSIAYCFHVPQPIAAFKTYLFVVFVAEKVFGVAAVFKHVLDEVVTGVGLVMHELCVGVLVEEEKENLDVTK